MTSTARIVLDVNENETVEIPFEYADNCSNGKTKRSAYKTQGSKAKFYYLDIKEYERRVRADERKRIKKQKHDNIVNFVKTSKALIKYAWQKSVGAAIVLSAINIVYNSYVVNGVMSFIDWSIAFLTIPVGLYIFFTNQFFFKKHM